MELVKNDWIMGILFSYADCFTDELVAKCAIRSHSLVGKGMSWFHDVGGYFSLLPFSLYLLDARVECISPSQPLCNAISAVELAD